MLVHLTPACFSWRNPPDALVDVVIPQFNLTLDGGRDLKIGRPYPNKHWHIAYAAGERRMKEGVLIEVNHSVEQFNVTTRWRFGDMVCSHQAIYTLIDSDCEAVSDKILIWYAYEGFEDCRPTLNGDAPPCEMQPRLEVKTPGEVRRRADVLWLPAMTRARVFTHGIRGDRMPSEQFIFHAPRAAARTAT